MVLRESKKFAPQSEQSVSSDTSQGLWGCGVWSVWVGPCCGVVNRSLASQIFESSA